MIVSKLSLNYNIVSASVWKYYRIFWEETDVDFYVCCAWVGCLKCRLARSFLQTVSRRAFSGTGGGRMTTILSIVGSDLVLLNRDIYLSSLPIHLVDLSG